MGWKHIFLPFATESKICLRRLGRRWSGTFLPISREGGEGRGVSRRQGLGPGGGGADLCGWHGGAASCPFCSLLVFPAVPFASCPPVVCRDVAYMTLMIPTQRGPHAKGPITLHLTDLFAKGAEGRFRLLSSFSFTLVNCMCCLLC